MICRNKTHYSVIVLACILLFVQANANAQEQLPSKIDSLKLKLAAFSGEAGKYDTNRINLLIDVSYEYYKLDPDTGIIYGQEALVASELIKWDKGMAMAGNRIGLCYWAKSDYPLSLEYHFRALKIAEKINYKPGIAIILGNIGLAYEGQRDYEKALDYHSRAMKMNTEIGDKSGVARNLGNIGIVYDARGDFKNALEYYQKALREYELLNDKNGIARNLGNIGFAYQLQNMHAEALAYHFRALEMNQELGNRILMGMNFGNIGSEYLSILQDTSVARRKLLPDSLRNSSVESKSEFYLNKSIALFKEIEDINSLQELYGYLSDLQALTGRYKESLASYKLHTDYRKSLYNEENERQIAKLERNREEDLKQKEIELLKSQNEVDRLTAQRRMGINYGLAGGMVLLGFVTISFSRQSKKRMLINMELEKANRELKETQLQLVKSEKMAAFGVMASRIAHEIQNPLNFVNNFSEISGELVQEIMEAPNESDKQESASLLKENLAKITHHGKRAEAIVRELQEHIRTGKAHEYFEEGKS